MQAAHFLKAAQVSSTSCRPLDPPKPVFPILNFASLALVPWPLALGQSCRLFGLASLKTGSYSCAALTCAVAVQHLAFPWMVLWMH